MDLEDVVQAAADALIASAVNARVNVLGLHHLSPPSAEHPQGRVVLNALKQQPLPPGAPWPRKVRGLQRMFACAGNCDEACRLLITAVRVLRDLGHTVTHRGARVDPKLFVVARSQVVTLPTLCFRSPDGIVQELFLSRQARHAYLELPGGPEHSLHIDLTCSQLSLSNRNTPYTISGHNGCTPDYRLSVGEFFREMEQADRDGPPPQVDGVLALAWTLHALVTSDKSVEGWLVWLRSQKKAGAPPSGSGARKKQEPRQEPRQRKEDDPEPEEGHGTGSLFPNMGNGKSSIAHVTRSLFDNTGNNSNKPLLPLLGISLLNDRIGDPVGQEIKDNFKISDSEFRSMVSGAREQQDRR